MGVFDLLHYGHIELLRRAKLLGDKLVVAVQTSEYVKQFKPDSDVFFSTDDRLYMVSSIKFVDFVTSYNTVDEIVRKIDFDVFVVGEDQQHQKFQEAIKYCLDNGKRVVRLSRTTGISTSKIKTILNHSLLDS